MEQKEHFELTARDLDFLRKFNALMEDSDGLSYYGLIRVFSSIVYIIHKKTCTSKMIESGGTDGLLDLIEDIKKDLDGVSGIIAQGVKDEVAELLGKNA